MAYAFLTINDVQSRIRDEHRNDIIDGQNIYELTCESQAIEKMKSYLNGRYDTTALFPPAPNLGNPDPRKQLIVLHCLNIFVYLLYKRINPRKIPEEVKLDHEETLDWLDKVAGGKISPDFPAVLDPEVSTNTPRFGGGKQMGGHYF